MRRSYDEADFNLDGDSLIQLDDGRILSFNFRKSYSYSLKIYEQKEYKEILSINLLEILKQNDKKLRLMGDIDLSVIQLKNKSILVCFYIYLIEIKLNEKSFESKIAFEYDENFLNINELPDGRIILITKDSILILNDFILKDKYDIKDNWRIVPVSLSNRYYGKFKQHFFSTIIPDERIIFRSFSTELSYHGGCGTHPPAEFTHSKIIFINTKNFEEIKTTEEFNSDCRDIVLENIIIIQANHDINLYDIKTLENIKKIKIKGEYNYFEKYNENEIIAYSKYENENDLLIFRVEGNDIVNSCEVKQKFKFNKVIGWNGYSIIEFKNKILFVLKDKRIILLCHNDAVLLNLGLE